ncbi:MAG: BON domain-containing protein [Pirellulaceae bacterium]|nr:BON domain-containing protein [Pirellulaceae bacterium]
MQLTQNRIGFGDEDVLWRVESYLESKHFAAFRNLHVVVDQGVVTIAGQVSNYHERQVALNCCLRVAGVLELVDQIRVTAGGERTWA